MVTSVQLVISDFLPRVKSRRLVGVTRDVVLSRVVHNMFRTESKKPMLISHHPSQQEAAIFFIIIIIIIHRQSSGAEDEQLH